MPSIRRLLVRCTLACAFALAHFGATVHAAPQPLELSAPEARQRAAAGAVTLIDVRRPEEWRSTGTPEGAARIDMLHPGGAEGFLNAVLTKVKGNRNAPIALICRTGNRSAQVQRFLQEQGFTRVFNVREGMAGSAAGPGWLERGLPIDACRQC